MFGMYKNLNEDEVSVKNLFIVVEYDFFFMIYKCIFV